MTWIVPARDVRALRARIDVAAARRVRGLDVDDQGDGVPADHRLHELIRQTGCVLTLSSGSSF